MPDKPKIPYRKPGQAQGDSPEAQEYKKWIMANHKAIEKQYGLPEGTLLVISAHESAFDPYALSRGYAKGAFQFTTATAKSFGLNIDGEFDERYDYVKSAHAAAKYMAVNMKRFGSFKAAIADWNGGGLAAQWVKDGKDPYQYVEKKSGNQELGGFLAGVEKKAKEYGYASLFGDAVQASQKPATSNPSIPAPEPKVEKKRVTTDSQSVQEFVAEGTEKASPSAKNHQKPSNFFNENIRRGVLKHYAEVKTPLKINRVALRINTPMASDPAEPKPTEAKIAPTEEKSVYELRPDLFRAYKSGGSIIQMSGDGKTVEAVLKGKERIFSRPDTKRLMELATKAKSDQDFFLLGKFLYDATKKQDSRDPEYVDA